MTLDAEHIRAQMDARSDEELIEILATRPDEEWEPAVYTLVEQLLQARGVSPERLMDYGPRQFDEGDEGVVLEQFISPAAAHQCRMVLEEAGLDCWMADEHMTGMHFQLGIAVGGVKVFVRRRELQTAREILQAVPAAVAADPQGESTQDTQACPRCGAPTVPSAPVTQRVETLSMFLVFGVPFAQKRTPYACEACGHTWTD